MKCKPSLYILFVFFISCTNPKYVLNTDSVGFVELLDAARLEQDKVSSLEAVCRISVDSEEYSGNFFADVYYIKGDSLLLSVRGPFGLQAGKLFVGPKRFIFYNQIANKFITGSVPEFKDKKFFQFPLQLSELINIFIGHETLSVMRVDEYRIDEDLFYIKTENEDVVRQIWIDSFSGRVARFITRNGEEELYRRDYGEFIKTTGIFFPRRISMERPAQKQAVSLYYTKLALNKPIDRQKFVINVSEGADQIEVPTYLP